MVPVVIQGNEMKCNKNVCFFLLTNLLYEEAFIMAKRINVRLIMQLHNSGMSQNNITARKAKRY